VLIQGNTIRYNVGTGIDAIINGGKIDISNGGAPLAIDSRSPEQPQQQRDQRRHPGFDRRRRLPRRPHRQPNQQQRPGRRQRLDPLLL